MEIQLNELVRVAMLHLSCTSLGFLLRLSGGKLSIGLLAGRAAALLVHPGTAITLGRLGVAVCLLAFCMFAGSVGMGSLGQLLGLPLPTCLGGTAVAALLRNTTEMTDGEFPDRELIVIGIVAFGAFLGLVVMQVVFLLLN